MSYDWPAWISRPQRTATTTGQTVQPKQQHQHVHFQEHEHTTDPAPAPAPNASHSHPPNAIDDATGPGPRLRRWSTVQQRRLSTDQLTLNGKIMQRRRQKRRTKNATEKKKMKEKGRKSKNKKAAVVAVSGASGLNTATIKSEPSPSKMTGLLGDWKVRVWRRSQWRAMSV